MTATVTDVIDVLPFFDEALGRLLPLELQVAPGRLVPTIEFSILDRLALLPEQVRTDVFVEWETKVGPEFLQLFTDGDWVFTARRKQLLPRTGWRSAFVTLGRGSGKTMMGSKWVLQRVRIGDARYIALVGRAAPDVRDAMIEIGPSSIMMVAPVRERPQYEPSKRRLTFPNGAIAVSFSAEEPDSLRGPQHDTAWCDEPATYPNAEQIADMFLMPGMRLGDPQVLWTGTPELSCTLMHRAKKQHKAQVAAIEKSGIYVDEAGIEWTVPPTIWREGSTLENLQNLAPASRAEVLSKIDTRLGQQEYGGVLFEDTPGALWTEAQLAASLTLDPAEIPQSFTHGVVVGVDPSVGDGSRDECGIVVVGMDEQGVIWVLEDGSLAASPANWAERVVECHDRWGAEAVVAELNQGGQLVIEAIQNVSSEVVVEGQRATEGKKVRAEPIAQKWEMGLARFAGEKDQFGTLIDQLQTWSPFTKGNSPDRLDALVWAATFLSRRYAKEGSHLPITVSSKTASAVVKSGIVEHLNGERANEKYPAWLYDRAKKVLLR